MGQGLTLDSDGGEDKRFGARLGAPPGSIWRHPKTGGWYWTLGARDRRRSFPLVPRGRKHATKAKSIAERVRRRMWEEMTQGGEKVPPKGMAAWIDEFQQWNEMSASARQARFNADVIRKFTRTQQVRHPWDVSADAAQAYLLALKEGGLAPATQGRHRSAIRKFCRYLMLKQQLDANPADQTETERVYHRPPRYLTTEQEIGLLRAAHGHPLFPAIVLALETGLRISEIIALRWRDVQPGGVVIGTDAATKTYQWRVVPVPGFVWAVLGTRGCPESHVFAQHGVRWHVEQLRRLTGNLPVFGEAGGVGNQWHLLRSTFAVNQARAGKTLWRIMELLGHSNPQTTMRYIDVARAAGVTHVD